MVIQVAAAQQLEKQSVDTTKTAVADAKREEQAAAQRASTAAHNAQLKEASALKVWDALVSTDSSITHHGLVQDQLANQNAIGSKKAEASAAEEQAIRVEVEAEKEASRVTKARNSERQAASDEAHAAADVPITHAHPPALFVRLIAPVTVCRKRPLGKRLHRLPKT